MRPGTRRTALAAALLVGGCAHMNALYNAERLFDEAERASWAGRDDEAAPLYDSVVAKMARTYRREPGGGSADDALYLLGRAHLRRGDPVRAAGALRQALERTEDARIGAGARLHLGIAMASLGQRDEALSLLDQALGGLQTAPLRAEGHLWRARLLLEAGRTDAGWADLDRAAEGQKRHRVAAGLERIRWGVAHRDSVRAREGAAVLLSLREAWVREDTLRALVHRAAERWGPDVGVRMLAGARVSGWPQASRDRMLLDRARLHLEAGDEQAAVIDASPVADGAGETMADARLLFAEIILRRAGTVEDLAPARASLLPAVADPRVLDLVETIRIVELLVERAEGDGPPEALFAAGEVARDVLGARHLARALLLRYAEASDRPWSGKALLAALDLTADPSLRPPLLRQMARMRNNPYVAASSGVVGAPPRLLELDAELQKVLTEVLAGVEAQARQLDVLARQRADTVR